MSTKFSTIKILMIHVSILVSNSFYLKCFYESHKGLTPLSTLCHLHIIYYHQTHFCYRPSLPIQMCDMSHEHEEEDDDNDNNDYHVHRQYQIKQLYVIIL